MSRMNIDFQIPGFTDSGRCDSEFRTPHTHTHTHQPNAQTHNFFVQFHSSLPCGSDMTNNISCFASHIPCVCVCVHVGCNVQLCISNFLVETVKIWLIRYEWNFIFMLDTSIRYIGTIHRKGFIPHSSTNAYNKTLMCMANKSKVRGTTQNWYVLMDTWFSTGFSYWFM